MACRQPLQGFYSRTVNESGKRSVVFDPVRGYPDLRVQVPCGQCTGCRLERSRQWAFRCVQEASLYRENCFITLTFDDEHLAESGSLVKADFQEFMKRLRRKYGPLIATSCWRDERTRRFRLQRTWKSCNVRYFHCGEYGERFGRPHHHACLFNFAFPDRVLWSVRDGVRLYVSKALQELWPFGFSTVGDVTFESAAYVARYVLKKVTGQKADDHYQGRVPEYTTMSRRPGIGRKWLERFESDVYPEGGIVIRGGVRCRSPRYYDSVFELTNPEGFERLKCIRAVKARERGEMPVQQRRASAMIEDARLALLRRTL